MVHIGVWQSDYPIGYSGDVMHSKPFCVGLTGGIGSGKTTVANLFMHLHVPIIDADEIARRITKLNTTAYHRIVEHFGLTILKNNRELDRKKLREIIFSNPIEKRWLENLLHPLIRQDMYREIQHAKFPYCICVIPLLTEKANVEFIDRILVVDTPIELQIERVKKRDQETQNEVQKIVDAQIGRDARLHVANDVIVNDQDLAELEKKVGILHQSYLYISR